jgi:hypothetical protein
MKKTNNHSHSELELLSCMKLKVNMWKKKCYQMTWQFHSIASVTPLSELRPTPMDPLSGPGKGSNGPMNKLLFLNGLMMAYYIFKFHTIWTPHPLFCCKLMSPQWCMARTRFLDMANTSDASRAKKGL